MEGPLKELAKLEKLTATKGKAPSISDSLDALLSSLQDAKNQLAESDVNEEYLRELCRTIDAKRKEVDDRQKEVYSAVSRLGKALDKKFTTPLPSYSRLFESSQSRTALGRTVAIHFLRTGQFDTAETFLEESEINISPELRLQFVELHQILKVLRNHDIGPALEWARNHRAFLQSRSSPLEFYLHRSQYIRLLFSSHPPDPIPAIAYANAYLRPFYHEHEAEFQRLMGCVAYLPLSKLQTSPYADLASPSLHFELEPLFAKEYCASLGMSRQVPLRVVGDIGGGGALARIEKGRKVMRERKSEWSQTDELPIEIPLLPENRYHSIFACPVSKEQATEQNPPMMMLCGHVIAKDSLHKLSKAGGRVKCPYCPTESLLASALRVYF
ncbi:putative CTLH/CRA C-terminal to LisH motif domain containing protein [Lyophyllum shimeji]|uniref:GID complex catalytic subunit 2 n=1 Tax=Lyophyllum shimeji TaxID=47721 RepID=A0A9P3PFD9_LYOSH|nr:putative CTLH/CRA C-terminal to LisH motif domain containing protein [Lyophyllum shimeji]